MQTLLCEEALTKQSLYYEQMIYFVEICNYEGFNEPCFYSL